jgi:hypothetical protein
LTRLLITERVNLIYIVDWSLPTVLDQLRADGDVVENAVELGSLVFALFYVREIVIRDYMVVYAIQFDVQRFLDQSVAFKPIRVD